MLPFLKVVLIALLYKSPKCLLSPGLFWYDHSLPFAGRIARSASALIELFTEAFSFSFVFVVVAVSCAICLNCSVLLSIASLSVGGGLGLVEFFLSASFLLWHVFLSKLSRSHFPTMVAASCFSMSLSCFAFLISACAVLTQCLI